MRNADEDRRTTPIQRKALKTATEQTIHACGGGASAQYSTRVGETQLCRCAGKEYPDFLAIDVATDLQIAAGYPYIAEAMCRPMGYALTRVEGEAKEPRIEDMNPILEDVSRLAVGWITAWADKHLDADERRELLLLLQAAERRIRNAGDNIANFVPRATTK